jgi:hypothetical protein
VEGECNLGQNALQHVIILIKYNAKPVTYISHFEIRIYTVFNPKNCKKMLKIIFSGHPRGLSPGFFNFL